MIRFYQKFISPFLGDNCRYYPSCSEFAKLQFKYNNFFVAFLKSTLRILRCNQLFKGGIDHPKVPCPKNALWIGKPVFLEYIFVPTKKGCILIKSFQRTNS